MHNKYDHVNERTGNGKRKTIPNDFAILARKITGEFDSRVCYGGWEAQQRMTLRENARKVRELGEKRSPWDTAQNKQRDERQ